LSIKRADFMDKTCNVFNYLSTFYICLSDVKILPEDYLKNVETSRNFY
jgi:hypothetical protein